MTSISWATDASGDWSDATNWNPQQVPGNADDATINAPGSYTVTISSGQTVKTLTLNASGATLAADGLLTLSDALTLAAGTFDLNGGGVIQGGTIVNDGGSLAFLGGMLDGVTYDGTLDLTPVGSSVVVADGLTLTGADGTGPGAIALGGSGNLEFDDNQTIDNATITEGDYSYLYEATTVAYFDNNDDTLGTLTLGPNLTIDQDSNGSSLGPNYSDFDGDTIFNEGVINAGGGTAYSSIQPGTFVNAGSIVVFDGDMLLIDPSSFANAAGGVITVLDGGSLDITPAAWTNDGRITVQAGGTLHLGGLFTTAQLGGVVDDGGIVYISNGTLVNTGTTLTVGPGSRFNQIVLNDTILNGTVHDSGSGILFQGGTLDGVTYDGTLDLTPYRSTGWIKDGLIATGVNGTGPGEIDLGNTVFLVFDDTQTIDNATIKLEGPFTGIYQNSTDVQVGDDTIPSGTLTFGQNLTLDQFSFQNFLSVQSYGGTIVNDGTINAEGEAIFYINPFVFTNNGIIRVFGGDTVEISAIFTNIADNTLSGGIYWIGAGGAIQFDDQVFTTLDADLTLDGADSIVDFNSSGDSLEAHLTDIGVGGALRIMGGRDFSTTNDLTIDGTLQLSGGSLQAASVTIDPTGMLIGYGTANLANGGSTVAQGGLLDIAGNVTGTGGLYIDLGSTLELGASDANTVTFQGVNATLIIDQPQEFTGQIAGYGLTDVIDLGHTHVTHVTELSSAAASTTLQLTLAGAPSIDLTLLGDFVGDTFATPADSAGTGTDLTIGSFLRPILTPSGATAAFTHGGAPVALDDALGVADATSTILTSATVSVTAGFLAGDTLNFADQNGITGSYDATTGKLVLSGAVGLAAYKAALDSITFSSSVVDPTNGGADAARTITWVANNGAGLDNIGLSVTTRVTVASGFLQPVLASGFSAHYFQGGPAVAVDPSLALSNPSNIFVTGATVSITNAVLPGDALNFIGQSGISGGYANGVLTLSGSATTAAYQAALDSVTFNSSNDDLTVGGSEPFRTVAIGVTNSAGASSVIGNTVYVYPEAPAFANGYNTVDYAVAGPPQVVDSAISVTDPAVANLTDASVTIYSGYLPSDVLGFVDQNGITGTYAGGILTLSGTASAAAYQAALASVTYSSTAADPGSDHTNTTRGIFFTAEDLGQGSSTSSTVDLTVLPPVGGTYALAAPTVAPATQDFGAVHVGNSPNAALVVSNTAASPAEGLDASVSSTAPDITASGSISLLAAGQTDITSLVVGLLTASDGVESGTVTVGLQSDGTGTSGAGQTPLPAQSVQVVGTVYAYAAPIFSATDLDLGAARVGDLALQGTITLGDGATPDAYQESLVYASAAGGGGTIVSGASHAFDVTLGTGTTGDFTGADATTETVDLTSTGVGTSGLADTALAPVQLTVGGQVYAPAMADYATTLDFGIVHVGQADTAALTIANTAGGALTDALIGSVASISDTAFSATSGLGGGVAAGSSGTLGFALDTATAGTFDASATLALASHDGALSDLALTGAPVALSGTVNNYATATVEELRAGGGELDVTNGTIALGTILAGSAPVVIDLAVANSAAGPADTLSGAFTVSASPGFSETLEAFSGIAAGAVTDSQAVTFDAAADLLHGGTAGAFSETITLDATGSNSSGYSGALAPVTVTITGAVLGALTASAPAAAAVGLGQTDPIAGLNLMEATVPGNARFTATVSDTSGVLTANGAGASLTGSGTTSLTVSGSLTQVNAALATVKDTKRTAAPDTLTLLGSDDSGNQATASVAVTTNAAPVFTAPAAVTLGIGQIGSVGGVSVSEAGLTAGETFTVTAADQRGLLAANGAGGAVVTGAGTIGGLTITGTLMQVNAALATLTATPGDTAPDKILVFVTDGLGNHAHAANIAVTTNGKPVIALPATGTAGVGQAGAVAGLSISESGNTAGESFTVVASDASGALAANGAGGAAIRGAGTGSLTIGGTLAQVNAALATLTDAAAATPSETLSLQVTDSLRNTAAGSVALTVNGPPVIAAPAAATVAVGRTVAIGGLALSETGNTTGERFSFALSDANGLLTANGAGVALTGLGTTSLTISGPLAQVNAALATVKDTDAVASNDTLTLQASDGYGKSTTRTMTVTVTVNPQPVVQATASATVVTGQAVAIGGVSIAEGGSTVGETFTVTVQDQRGLLAASGSGVSGSGTVGGLTVTGTLAQVNTALATLTDTAGDSAPDKILVFVTDSYGNHAHAGGIAVGVNGKPMLAAPAAAVVAVDQATTIAGVLLSESGATTGEIFTVTLSDTAGLLTASPAGVTIGGAGTTSLTVSGTLANVNTALATLADTAPGTASDNIAVSASDSYGGAAVAAGIPVTVSGVVAPAATASVRAGALHLGGAADPAWGTGEGGVTVSLLNGMGIVIGTTVSDNSGHATFAGLAAGTYDLQYATPAGQGFVPGGPDSAGGATVPFTVAAGQSLAGPTGNLIATLALNGTDLTATPAAGGYLVTGNAADSTLTLGSYNEYVALTGGGDTVTTGNGNETITLSGAGNIVTVGVGNSVIDAGDGGATVHAAAGDITITAAGASNLFDGGSGLSFLNADGSANNVFMLGAAGTPVANMTTVTGFNPAAGDTLDLKHTLAGANILPDLSNLASFVTAASAGPNTVLLVDPTGGQATPTAFATLLGTHVSVAQLQALHEFSIS